MDLAFLTDPERIARLTSTCTTGDARTISMPPCKQDASEARSAADRELHAGADRNEHRLDGRFLLDEPGQVDDFVCV